jgi:hypothetical protein
MPQSTIAITTTEQLDLYIGFKTVSGERFVRTRCDLVIEDINCVGAPALPIVLVKQRDFEKGSNNIDKSTMYPPTSLTTMKMACSRIETGFVNNRIAMWALPHRRCCTGSVVLSQDCISLWLQSQTGC